MLDTLIEQLSKELNMGGAITPNEKRYDLSFEPDIDVRVMDLKKSFLFKANICPCPEKNRETFLLKVLESNLFGLGTRNASIGLDEQEKTLTLSLEVDDQCSFNEFKGRLQDFVSVLSAWRDEANKNK